MNNLFTIQTLQTLFK